MKAKQFKVPANTKLQITQEGDKVVIEFVPEKVEFKPKDGDFLTDIFENVTFIYRNDGTDRLNYYVDIDGFINDSSYWSFTCDKNVRLSTDTENQLLIDTLKAKGLRWNAEEKKVEKIRWRAELNCSYYFVDSNANPTQAADTNHYSDTARYNASNYFKTEGHAEAAAKLFREALLKF